MCIALGKCTAIIIFYLDSQGPQAVSERPLRTNVHKVAPMPNPGGF